MRSGRWQVAYALSGELTVLSLTGDARLIRRSVLGYGSGRQHEKGISGAVWFYLQCSYLVDCLRAVIDPGVAMYEWYSDGLGCAQGAIQSPLMFDLEFNDVLACVEQVRHTGAGVDIGNGRRFFGQLCADDELLFAETEEGLQTMIDALVGYCTETCRRISTSKCEIIVIGDSDEGAVTGVNIRIGDETIPEKQTVRYLGASFGAQDILQGSPQMLHTGWKPAHSAWFAHACPKLRAAYSRACRVVYNGPSSASTRRILAALVTCDSVGGWPVFVPR